MRDCRKFRMKIEFVVNSKGKVRSLVWWYNSEKRIMNPFDDIEQEIKKQKEAMKQEKERRLVNTIELKETIGGLFENQKYRIELKRVEGSSGSYGLERDAELVAYLTSIEQVEEIINMYCLHNDEVWRSTTTRFVQENYLIYIQNLSNIYSKSV